LIENSIDFSGIKVASLRDLAASKIGAIASRGTKRDFTDLFYIFKSGKAGNLQDFLKYYDQRFKNLSNQKIHVLKSLTYFDDADKDEDPKMLVSDYSWNEVKKTLVKEVNKLI
jgi:predicted nucleotidyltransferase component of viral defense system